VKVLDPGEPLWNEKHVGSAMPASLIPGKQSKLFFCLFTAYTVEKEKPVSVGMDGLTITEDLTDEHVPDHKRRRFLKCV